MELLESIISKLNSTNRKGDKIKYLQSFDDRQFEFITAELYAAYGYNTFVTQATNDEGKDVIAEKGTEKVIIECKRYGHNSYVGREVVQKLAGVVKIENATRGIILTTNLFNENASSYIAKNNITWISLIDINGLLKLFRKAPPRNLLTGTHSTLKFDQYQTSDWEKHKSDILSQIIDKLTLRAHDCIIVDRDHILIYPVSITDNNITGIAIYSEYNYRKFTFSLKFPRKFNWGSSISKEERAETILLNEFEFSSEFLGEKILLHRDLATKYTQHLFSAGFRYTTARTKYIEKIREREQEENRIKERNVIIERYNQIYKKKLCFKPKIIFYTAFIETNIIPYDEEKAKIMDYI